MRKVGAGKIALDDPGLRLEKPDNPCHDRIKLDTGDIGGATIFFRHQCRKQARADARFQHPATAQPMRCNPAQIARIMIGAGELANGIFRRPGEADFRDGWDDLGSSLETAVSESDYSSLSRCTQYAHFTTR